MKKIIPSSKLQNPSPFKLANCPWPPDDSHCSTEGTVWADWDMYGACWEIWGKTGGDDSSWRYYSQAFSMDTISTTLKRLVFRVGRHSWASEPTVPNNEGVYVGIVSATVLNDTNLLYDTTNWEWVGYIAQMSPGQNEYYCGDVNLSLNYENYWYLIMLTNGSQEECGWEICGFAYDGFPSDWCPYYRYSYNVPGYSNGWYTMDDMHKGCAIPYLSVGGAIVEPDTWINNPNFPANAQEGQNYNYSFSQVNDKAFPCGCPASLWMDIKNRDTNETVVSRQSMNNNCGSDMLTWNGTIVFSGGGVFHGRLRAGHVVSGSDITDDTYDFDVTIGGTPCSNWTNQSDCSSHGCHWYNNSCHDSGPTQCSQLNNETDCVNYGCYWCNGVCQSSPCGGGDKWLDIARTTANNTWGCDPHAGGCYCSDVGPQKTTFNLDEEVIAFSHFQSDGGDFYGDIARHEWWFNGEMKWSYDWPPLENHWSNWCVWTYWQIGFSYGPGIGHIKIYLNGTYVGKTNDFEILAPPCNTATNQSDCENWGCYWYDGACHDNPPATCGELNNQSDCERLGCYWWNGICHGGGPYNCSDLNNQTDCTAWGCYWYDGSCHYSPSGNYLVIQPVSNGTYNQMGAVGDSPNWKCVDDPIHAFDSDATYIYDTWPGYNPDDSFIGNQHTTETGTITKVEHHIIARTVEATAALNHRFIINGNLVGTDSVTVSNINYEDKVKTFTTNPVTGQPWTWSDIDNLEFGVRGLFGGSGNNQLRITQIYLIVYYEPATTGLCDYISDKGGPSGLTITNVFEVIDAYLFQTPPTGYTFVPTIVEVFGVVDYYLGFDGDAQTGCDFF